MISKVFRAVDKAPFAGKFLIKDAYVNYDTADDKTKTKKYFGTSALLVGMAMAHAYQAHLGYGSFGTHLGELQEGRVNAENILRSGFDASYVATMGLVALRQAALLAKAFKKYFTWVVEKPKVPEGQRKRELRPYTHKASAAIGAFAFTLAAQVGAVESSVNAAQLESGNKRVAECVSEWNYKISEYPDTDYIITMTNGSEEIANSANRVPAYSYCESTQE